MRPRFAEWLVSVCLVGCCISCDAVDMSAGVEATAASALRPEIRTWDEVLESWNDRWGGGVQPDTPYEVIQLDGPGSIDQGSRYTGFDRDENGILTRDEFRYQGRYDDPIDHGADEEYRSGIDSGRLDLNDLHWDIVIEEWGGNFHHSAPDPIDALHGGFVVAPAGAPAQLADRAPYIQRWLDSGIGDWWSVFAYRNIRDIQLSSWSSPSFYDKKRRVVWISTRDKDHFGVVALDHELMLAGLELGFREGVITWSQYRQLARLNQRRFDHLDGYVGQMRGAWVAEVSGGKSFVTGQQYRKLRWHARHGTLNALDLGHAQRYMSEVESNVLVSHNSAGEAVYMIDSRNRQSDVDGYLGAFTKSTSATYQEIEAVKAAYPWPNLKNLERLPGQDLVAKECTNGWGVCQINGLSECINLSSDRHNCGFCGNYCGAGGVSWGMQCRYGVCHDQS